MDKIKFYFNNKTALITGAGGSIGGELCNQLLKQKPKKIVLLEFSEHSLYKINQELNQIRDPNIKVLIKPLLGNASDSDLLKTIFSEYNVNILFHAATCSTRSSKGSKSPDSVSELITSPCSMRSTTP